jgi:hypothetical protein
MARSPAFDGRGARKTSGDQVEPQDFAALRGEEESGLISDDGWPPPLDDRVPSRQVFFMVY